MKDIQTEIHVTQLALSCLIGVPKEEREVRQIVLVDIMCELVDPAISEDDMSASVNYSWMVKQAQQIALEQEFALLETLAATIASTVLESEQRIKQITVSCNKPNKCSSQTVGVRRTFGR